MSSTRWNVAVTVPTSASQDEINHLTVMLSMNGGEVVELTNRLVVKATSDYETDAASAVRAILYPIEAWLRLFRKVVNFYGIEVDAVQPPRSRTGVVDCPHLPPCQPYLCPKWSAALDARVERGTVSASRQGGDV
jgi:hypothetical protein